MNEYFNTLATDGEKLGNLNRSYVSIFFFKWTKYGRLRDGKTKLEIILQRNKLSELSGILFLVFVVTSMLIWHTTLGVRVGCAATFSHEWDSKYKNYGRTTRPYLNYYNFSSLILKIYFILTLIFKETASTKQLYVVGKNRLTNA